MRAKKASCIYKKMNWPLTLLPSLQCIQGMQYILLANNFVDQASDQRMWDSFLPNVKGPEARLQL